MEEVSQLYESIHTRIGTQERARQLVQMIREAFELQPSADPLWGPHKSEWTVDITSSGNLPINIIKELRDRYRTMTLKECVNSLHALRDHGTPWRVRSGIGYEEANDLKRALERLGATVGVY